MNDIKTANQNSPYQIPKLKWKSITDFPNFYFWAELVVAALMLPLPCLYLYGEKHVTQDEYLPWFICIGAMVLQTLADRFLLDKDGIRESGVIKVLRSIGFSLPLIPLCSMWRLASWLVIIPHDPSPAFILYVPFVFGPALGVAVCLITLQITSIIGIWSNKKVLFDSRFISLFFLCLSLLSMLFFSVYFKLYLK